MTRPLRIGLAMTAAFGLAVRASAGPRSGNEAPDFSHTSLGAGLSAGFGLLRLGGAADGQPLPLEGNLVGRPDAILRVLVDPTTGAALGYRVEAATLSSTIFGAIRVDIRALTRDDENEIRPSVHCDGCPTPHLVGSGPTRFPGTQVSHDGDTMLIDLLVRPDTGEKVVDVV